MTPIQFKRSCTAGTKPSACELVEGEIALNLADGAVYSKDCNGAIVSLGGTAASSVSVSAGDADGGTYDDNLVTPVDCSTLPICGLVDGGNF
jgi:hypothetical protein